MASHILSTCRAPVNIAVIKYWGKTDERLIIPTNDSLSLTLSTDDLCATTTIAASPDYSEDRLWLNGKVRCTFRNEKISQLILNSKSSGKYDTVNFALKEESEDLIY